MIKHQLLIHTSMKHSLPVITFKALALHSLDTLSDVRIKAFTFLFKLRCSVYSKREKKHQAK